MYDAERAREAILTTLEEQYQRFLTETGWDDGMFSRAHYYTSLAEVSSEQTDDPIARQIQGLLNEVAKDARDKLNAHMNQFEG